jgi:hypothetical protein
VVWVPRIGGAEKDVPAATTTVPDRRARHYWDEGGVTMRAFRETLGLREDAWDVYLIYGPEARWDGPVPPAPVFWMHQLTRSGGTPRAPGPLLEGEVFRARLAGVVAR